jgi:hypothetical protein
VITYIYTNYEQQMAESSAVDSGVPEFKNLFGARVHCPIDMPDAMVKHAIESARKSLAACDDWQSKVNIM